VGRAKKSAFFPKDMVQYPSGHPDLSNGSRPGKPVEVWVAIRVATDFVSFFLHPQHEFRILFGGTAHNEESSSHRVISKDVQHPRGMDWIRSVINGDGNLRPVPTPMLK